jgi:alpha,alpha-trehalase
MLEQARSLAGNSARQWFKFSRHGKALTEADVKVARAYIADYWAKLERRHTKDDGSVMGLPKPYLVSSYEEGREFDFNEMYYWDSYFTVQGFLHDKKHKELVMGILEDLLFMFKRYHVIPNASRTYLTGRSQPPFLSTFILDVYNAFEPGDKWLKSSMEVAKKEYETVWMGTAKPNARLVYRGLSRYYDINHTHDLAEAESGWDYTPRFNRRCLIYLPVDLNTLLYKYETDFAHAARLLGDPEEASRWEKAAKKRLETIDELMWDRVRGLYCDYNYFKERRGVVASLATYYPLWAGMVDDKRAKALVKSLRRFEQKGGLATTDSVPLGKYVPGAMPTQWAYPNGWAPLHFLVVEGLKRYGYHDDARRIAFKWLRNNLEWFNQNGLFLEKYNVVATDKPPIKGVYPTQTGFGWTNAIFERFCQDFIDSKE